MSSLRVKLALLAASTLLAFAALEGLVRVRQYLKYGSTSPTVHEFAVDPGSGLRIPTPGSSRAGIAINSLGFRGPEIPAVKPEGTIRVAFLGASTTYCAEVSSNVHTWPDLVTNALRAKFPGHAFDYLNAAVPGYTTAESLQRLEHDVAPLHPDIIVIYHATNDLSGDTRGLAKEQGLASSPGEQTSWLGEHSVLWFLLEKNWTVYERQSAARGGGARLSFDARDLSRSFEERMSTLVARAQETAPVVALVTFSHRIRHDQTPEERIAASNTSLYYMPYMSVDGLLAGFDEYNRVIRNVAGERGTILIDGEDSIPGDAAHFADSVHFTDAGAQAMADRVVEGLVSAAVLQRLVIRQPSRLSRMAQ